MTIKSFYTLAHPYVAYEPDAVTFAGSDRMHLSSMTGQADGTQMTWSFWVRFDSLNALEYIICNDSTSLTGGIYKHTGNKFRAYWKNTAGTVILNQYTAKVNTTSEWVHFMGSVDTANASYNHMYVNGVSDNPTPTMTTGNTFDFTPGNSWRIGAGPSATALFDGDLSEVYWTDEYIDLSVKANREKFIKSTGSGATPVDLGSDASGVTGTAPLIYFAGDAAVWNAGTNSGSGGNFNVVGTITNSTNEPVVAD